MAAEFIIECRETFGFAACCWHLEELDTSLEPRPSLIHLINARDPGPRIVCMASGSGSVPFRYAEAAQEPASIAYSIETTAPLPSDGGKPEPFRRLHLRADSRPALEAFVYASLARYREEVFLRREGGNGGVTTYSWVDDDAYWDKGQHSPLRPLSSIFLPEGVAENILSDVRSFYDTSKDHAHLHLSPVRVYLLAGVPGAGKTSLIQGIASEIKSDIASLSFGSHMTDRDLENAIAHVPSRCILKIEDLDCLVAKRGDQHFASLLKVLDGFGSTPNSPLAIFVTTNHPEKLDAAIRRRVDSMHEFGYAGREQCRRMFTSFGFDADKDFSKVWAYVLSRPSFPASVFHKYLTKCLQHDNPHDCLPVLDELIRCVAASEGRDRAQALYA